MSTPPAGASPSPKKSFRGRMGTMLRRSSTAFSRSSNDSQTDLQTPPLEASPPPSKPARRASIDSFRSSSSSSRPSGELKRIDTSSSIAPKNPVSRLMKAMVPSTNNSSAPSPIAESPMREEMETAAARARMTSLTESPVVVTAPAVDHPPALPAPAPAPDAAPAPDVAAAPTSDAPAAPPTDSLEVQEPTPIPEVAAEPAPAPLPQITESPTEAQAPKEAIPDPVVVPEETPAKAEPEVPVAVESKEAEPEAQPPVAVGETKEPEIIVESPVEQVSQEEAAVPAAQEAIEEPSQSEPAPAVAAATTEEQPASASEPPAPEEPVIPAVQEEAEEPQKPEPVAESAAVAEDAPANEEGDDAGAPSILIVESPVSELEEEEAKPSLHEEPISNTKPISHVQESTDATAVEPELVPEPKDSIIISGHKAADYFAEDAPTDLAPPPPFEEEEDEAVLVKPVPAAQEQPVPIVIPALSTHRDRALNHSSSESSLNTDSSDHDHVHQYGNPWATVGDAATKHETIFHPPYANGKQTATYEDPFADPPVVTVATSAMPEPQLYDILHSAHDHSEHELPQSPTPPGVQHPSIHDQLGMPAPGQPAAFVKSMPQTVPTIVQPQPDTTEYTPLLAPAASAASTSLKHAVSPYTLHSLGWITYALPPSQDEAYYHYPAQRLTVDADLRDPHILQAVNQYLVERRPGASLPSGWELWLVDESSSFNGPVGKSKPHANGKAKEWSPIRRWVDHNRRAIRDKPPTVSEELGEGSSIALEAEDEDERMDNGYRYWSFVEAHPAHLPLPFDARSQASDVLSWTYTDRMIPPDTPGRSRIPPPFTREECQELMNILSSTNPTPMQSVIQTRTVARVLIRTAQWRQAHFRPDRSLPTDLVKVNRRSRPAPLPRRLPLRKALLDFAISIACLGIPYAVLARSQTRRFDSEGGFAAGQRASGVGHMLFVGACACLISAVILSAAVTLISFPAVDSIVRLSALLAILFASAALGSAAIVLVRHKAESVREAHRYGGGVREGMVLTGHDVMISLPLVFTTYAVLAFFIGIMIFSFTTASPVGKQFAEYTRWIVIGAGGGIVLVMLLVTVLS